MIANIDGNIDRKTKRHVRRKLLIVILIGCCLILSAPSVFINSGSSEKKVPAGITYSSHAPISIGSDAGFTNASGVTWGSGTPSDPYIIEGWDITAGSSIGIYVHDVASRFIIRSCWVHDGTVTGIELQSVSGDSIINCSIARILNIAGMGVEVQGCSYIDIIRNNFSSGCNPGLHSTSSYMTVRDNYFEKVATGIVLDAGASHGSIYHNWFGNITNYAIVNPGPGFGGAYNHIWNNSFFCNNGATGSYSSSHIQAIDTTTYNWWNSSSGYGNYWYDWTTPDSVPPYGIVDKPYNLSVGAGAKDYYPLTGSPVSPPIPEFPDMIIPIIGMIGVVLVIRTRRSRR